jgi:hypothetical protein
MKSVINANILPLTLADYFPLSRLTAGDFISLGLGHWVDTKLTNGSLHHFKPV